MRLTTVLFIASLLQVSASTFGQKITINQQNVPLKSVFKEIRKQSGFNFYFDGSIISPDIKSSINVSNASVEEALKNVLANLPLTYQIKDRTVLITKKALTTELKDIISRFQAIDVKGKVVDSLGNGLPGATVSVKNGKGSTSTDGGGNFILRNVEDGSTLTANYLGFISKEVIASQDFTYIILKQSESKLDEVQIQAYGVTSRRLTTGNISSVKAEDIERQPVSNPLLALAGRIPGLEIAQSSGYSGSAVKIRIQGTNSINPGANEPFYVVDGVPYPSTLLPNLAGMLGSTSTTAYGNPLSYINPQDIESIEVLKDASATAIYGSRAANGAVLITTKKGKQGDSRVNVNLQSGIGRVARKLDLLNTQQYLEVRREAYKNDGIDFVTTFPFGLTAAEMPAHAPDLFVYDQNRYTDWQKELIGNSAKYNDAQVSLSGGNANVRYLVSGNYHKETTVFPGDQNDQKGSVHFSLNTLSANQKFKMSFGGSYMADKNTLSGADLTNAAMTLSPNAPSLYNADGTLNWSASPQSDLVIFDNPLGQYSRIYRNNTENLIGNANLSYYLLPNLVLTANLGYNKLQTEEISTNPATTTAPQYRAEYERSAQYGNNKIASWIFEPQATYNFKIGQGRIDALVGASLQNVNSDRKLIEGRKYRNDLVLENANAAEIITAPSTIITNYRYGGLFGRLNYNYLDRYVAEVSLRRDGSSRFGSKNRFHNFAALSGAWLFTNEAFLKNRTGFISFGKLRGSYGSTGSDQINDYRYLSLYYNNNVEVPYAGSQGLQSAGLPNSFLQWEETKKLSLGVDLGFFKDRVLTSVTYFRNRTSNQLLFYALPPSVGYTGIDSNFPATVQNTGLEFSLNTINIQSSNFKWRTNFNFTVPDNKLLSFPNIMESVYSKELTVGKSINQSPKLFKYSGVDPTTGVHQYVDKNGNLTSLPMFEADNDYMRFRAGQLLFGGIQNTIAYGNFTIDFLISYVKQNGLNYYYGLNSPGTTYVNQPVTALERWQKVGDEKPFSKYSATDLMTFYPAHALAQSDASWKDASYLRLKNASLAWRLPEQWLTKVHVQNAKLYLQGQNLFTITKYKGLDPESLSSLSLPPLRVITFGIQATF